MAMDDPGSPAPTPAGGGKEPGDAKGPGQPAGSSTVPPPPPTAGWFRRTWSWGSRIICDLVQCWTESTAVALVAEVSGTFFAACGWFFSQVCMCVDYFGDMAFGTPRWATMKLFVWGVISVSTLFLLAGLMATCQMFCNAVCLPFYVVWWPFSKAWQLCKLGAAAYNGLPILPHRQATGPATVRSAAAEAALVPLVPLDYPLKR